MEDGDIGLMPMNMQVLVKRFVLNIVRVDGKLVKCVSCFTSHNNEFVRRFRRFLGR